MYTRQHIGHVTLGVKARRALWCVASALLFRPFITKVFRLWRIALLRVFGAKVAWSAEVYASAHIWAPWNLVLDEGACIGPQAIVYNQATVRLGRRACLSQYAYLCTAGHESGNNAQTGLVVASIVLQEEAWVGTRAYVGMGVDVGQRAIVGACACVFKDVEAGTVVGGNPAKVLKQT